MLKKLVMSALIATGLDLGANFVLWWLWKQVSPLTICQVIASGMVGKAAFSGGYGTAAMGLAVEYLLILAMALGYYTLIRLWPAARRHWGAAVCYYGLFLYVVMNYVVVPLSAAGRPYPWPVVFDVKLLFNLFCHVALVSLPFGLTFRDGQNADQQPIEEGAGG